MSTPITWIPAHPAYGSISMYRYWKLLAAESLPGDAYRCQTLIHQPAEAAIVRAGKFSR